MTIQAPATQPATAGAERSRQGSVKTSDTHGTASGPGHQLLALQRAAGNRAVAAMLQRNSAPRPAVQRDENAPQPLNPLQDVTVEGRGEGVAQNEGRSMSLRGLTEADFAGSTNTAATEDVAVAHASGCSGCSEGDPCVAASATVVSTYDVPISVTLPTIPADANDCERDRAQQWINTVLEPHEQRHVQAFQTYNGTTRHPLRFTTCQSRAQAELLRRVQAMHDAEVISRQRSAQTASNALDPFNTTIDIDGCEDESATAGS